MNIIHTTDEKINIITGYNTHSIFINQIARTKKLFLSTETIKEHHIELKDLKISDIEWIIEEIERQNLHDQAVIIIADDQEELSIEIKKILISKSIGFDVMGSNSAYRTYNILASEGRKVYAILF